MIVVVGSINVDVVLRTENFVKPGETIKGKSVEYFLGGKGLNQATAIRRAGETCEFIGAIGKDNQELILDHFKTESITNYLQNYEETGKVYIEVESSGNNRIIVFANANGQMVIDKNIENILEKTEIIVLQNEINEEVNNYIFSNYRSKIVYNPSPILEESLDISNIESLVLNEIELECFISNTNTIEEKMLELSSRNISNIVVTLGDRGAILLKNKEFYYSKPQKVANVVDTTGAGDTFLGYFVAHHNEKPQIRLDVAVKYATKSIQKEGATSSIPRKEENEV